MLFDASFIFGNPIFICMKSQQDIAATAGAITVALGEAYIDVMELVFKGEMNIKDLEGKKGKEIMTKLFKESLKNK